MNKFELGDRVKRADITPESIPAYRDMRGKVVAVSAHGGVRVCWGPDDTDVLFRDPETICLA